MQCDRGMGAHREATIAKATKDGFDESFWALGNEAGATFQGKGEAATVQQMFAEFEWVLKTAMEQATQHAESGLTVAPSVARRVRRARLPPVGQAPSERPDRELLQSTPPSDGKEGVEMLEGSTHALSAHI